MHLLGRQSLDSFLVETVHKLHFCFEKGSSCDVIKFKGRAVDKAILLRRMCEKIELDLVEIKEAALNTLEAATNEESKAENKYDTRGLEASYLAGAQAKRVQEMRDQLFAFKSAKIRKFTENDPIALTALVEFETNEKVGFVFILEKGGGVVLSFEGVTVQAIAPNSPLGKALLGRRVGDLVQVRIQDSLRDYEILSIV